MDISGITVVVLFSTVLLRIVLVVSAMWLLLPCRRRCPACHEATESLVTLKIMQSLRVERRWCLVCGWSGLSKVMRQVARPAMFGATSVLPILVLVSLGPLGCAPSERDIHDLFTDSTAWVDLSYPFNSQTIYWPTARAFELEQVAEGMTPGGYYYAANNFSAAEHGGTHLDAPVHFAEGRETTDKIPIGRLIGPAVVIDVTEHGGQDPDYLISVADVEVFESRHGRLAVGTIVLFRTGWGERWPNAAAYLGTAERGEAAVASLHFPGIDPGTARWLVNERSVKAVGIDTPSIDYGQSSTFEMHQILFARGIPAFENVANLDLVPETGAYVIALPMKIAGGSGGPLRIVAAVP